VLDTHDLPNDVDHLKRLVLEHRSRVQAQQLEIERLVDEPGRAGAIPGAAAAAACLFTRIAMA